MKIEFLHRRVVLACLTALMCVASLSCGDDDDPEVPVPDVPSNPTGEVEFVFDLPSGIGEGSSSFPATIGIGDTLNVSIAQKSVYKDPDGSVFTCEPEASIVLYATNDTVYAHDLAALTEVNGSPDVKTGRTGTSPAVEHTLQTFSIGAQDIVFDLSHEIHTHVNSLGKPVEMPYVRINPAKFGSGGATEEKPQGRSSIAVTGVTVRPIAPSRGETVRDTTLYDVNVRFNLEVESVNTPGNEKRALEFSVNYVGGVETLTELLDPVSTLSYAWDVRSGTDCMSPPFVRTHGSTMEVWMQQRSSYTDEYGNEASGSPIAKIKLTAAQDTVWVSSPDELKSVVDKTGELLSGQSAKQLFACGAQEIGIEWSYESCEATIADVPVPMPYYALDAVSLSNLEVKELDYAQVNGKECDLYEVVATFSQKAVPQNMPEGTPSVEVEYVVKYIGAVEIKMVMVEYFPGGYLEYAPDKFPITPVIYWPYVERYRTYSNGKRVGPDTFYDYGHYIQFVVQNLGIGSGEGYFPIEEDWIYAGPFYTTNIGDSIKTMSQTFKTSWMPDNFNHVILYEGYSDSSHHIGNWDKYITSNGYSDDSFNLCKGVYCPDDWEEDSRPNGWYFNNFFYYYQCDEQTSIPNQPGFNIGFNSTFCLMYHDQFLVIDGRRIDFRRLHNLRTDFNFTEQDFSEPGKQGKIFKFEMDATYLGKHFYGAQTDTIYGEK